MPPAVFTRVLRDGDQGIDVEGVGRAYCRAGVMLPIAVFHNLPVPIKRKFGFRKVSAQKKLEARWGQVKDGVYDKKAHERLLPSFDAYAKALMLAWEPPPPPVVAPKQGFHSLSPALWEGFSLGRRMGLTDLGTYNPSSTLPSGAKSDHAYWPARAFDLGFSPQIGWDNLNARAFFNSMVERPEVEYVILGNKIWSRDAGLHAYTGGGHDGHVHVSQRK